MIERLTILGGSSVYIPEFITSMISRNLHLKEVVLYGRTQKKLDIVAAFCQRLIKKSGFPITVHATTDLKEAVTDANIILNHIRVGGMQARIRDEMIPPTMDLIGDENLGAGGFANAMRTLPVVFDLVSEIETINPDATFINLTNPMGVILEGLNRYSSINAIGVCDLPAVYAKKVARILEHELADLRIDYLGLNHLGWIQDVKLDGRSRMARLLERIEDHEENGFDYALIELFRMIPTRTMGMFFHRSSILKQQKSCSRFRAEALHEAEKQILKLYADESLCEVPELTQQRQTVWYDETILPLIESLQGEKKTEHILCVKNDGAIRDLPDEASVEIPVGVSRRGAKPRKVGSLPRFLKGMYLAAKESDRLTVEAVRHRSYESALQALTINPFVPSIEQAKKFLDRIVKEDQLELH